jgi:hypothetical protein
VEFVLDFGWSSGKSSQAGSGLKGLRLEFWVLGLQERVGATLVVE